MEKPITITLTQRQQQALLDCIQSWKKHLSDHGYPLKWIATYAQSLAEIWEQIEPITGTVEIE